MTATAITCPNCNAAITDFDKETGSGVCPYCGSIVYDPDFPGADKQVVEVHLVDDTDHRATDAQATSTADHAAGISDKSKSVAFTLCLILGAFGAHRFYAGKIGTGVLWLFTCGLFCIGWIYDLICIAGDRFTDASGRPITVESGGGGICVKCGQVVGITRVKCPACGTPIRPWWKTWWAIALIVWALCWIVSLAGIR